MARQYVPGFLHNLAHLVSKLRRFGPEVGHGFFLCSEMRFDWK